MNASLQDTITWLAPHDESIPEATRAVQADGFVQDLVNLFDGRVVDSTIREKQP
jgi:hypothetical protein